MKGKGIMWMGGSAAGCAALRLLALGIQGRDKLSHAPYRLLFLTCSCRYLGQYLINASNSRHLMALIDSSHTSLAAHSANDITLLWR